MSVVFEYQLYEFDLVADGLIAAINNAVNSIAAPVQVTGKYPTVTSNTPRVSCIFTPGQANPTNRRIVTPDKESKFQPYNTYFFTFTTEIVTQREVSGEQMRPLVAKARMAMQLKNLNVFGKAHSELWLYHTIIDIGELAATQLATNDADTEDSTIMTFSGQFQIAETAWP